MVTYNSISSELHLISVHLQTAHILQWKKVCEVLSIGEERELELLDAIERSATLVAGRWIIKRYPHYHNNSSLFLLNKFGSP
jgi:hypothetical protein